MDSYGKFMELAMNPKETGAYLRQSVFYFKEKVKKQDLVNSIKFESSCILLSLIRNDIQTDSRFRFINIEQKDL